MKILLAPDKFKGSLTAKEIIKELTDGILTILPTAEISSIEVSDGGDGFLNAISKYRQVVEKKVPTVDPLGRKIEGTYLMDQGTKEAFIEMAVASGLAQLNQSERNPLLTSTLGTGLIIRDAILNGAKKIVLGIGGSATNDAGIGIAHSLGYQFLDADGNGLKPIGANLSHIESIQKTGESNVFDGIGFVAINDVDNPLYGIEGAAHVYGPQKGADANQVAALDQGLRHLAKLVKEELGKDIATLPGTGAAGGTAFGLKAFFNAEFKSGAEYILEMAQLPKLIYDEQIDLIITGEGSIDEQSLRGKLIHGILSMSGKYNIPVIGICGSLDIERTLLEKEGMNEVIEIKDPDKPLAWNMANAKSLLATAIQKQLPSIMERLRQ